MKIYALIASSALIVSSSIALSQNFPYPANSTFFTGQPPVLVTAETLDSYVGWPNAHYYFTCQLPASSVESLGQVTIQQETSIETINFNLSDTYVFQGTQNNRGQAIAFKVTQDAKTQAINVTFEPPISPGTTFTVRLEATQNPSQSGVYLFRVSTFPAGSSPIGLDMGVGRLSFYQRF
jgi:hypothetical protein